jgi:hypothetical protein
MLSQKKENDSKSTATATAAFAFQHLGLGGLPSPEPATATRAYTTSFDNYLPMALAFARARVMKSHGVLDGHEDKIVRFAVTKLKGEFPRYRDLTADELLDRLIRIRAALPVAERDPYGIWPGWKFRGEDHKPQSTPTPTAVEVPVSPAPTPEPPAPAVPSVLQLPPALEKLLRENLEANLLVLTNLDNMIAMQEKTCKILTALDNSVQLVFALVDEVRAEAAASRTETTAPVLQNGACHQQRDRRKNHNH